MSFVSYKRIQSAVTKGQSAGRQALLRRLIAPISWPIDKAFYRKTTVVSKMPPCVIICSPPRSGSTLIYQVLARIFHCSFIANLHQLAPRHATELLTKGHQLLRPADGLQSFYGHTSALTDVSEGNEMVNYWFKTFDEKEIRLRVLETMEWLQASVERPAIIKNVGLFDKISLLYAAVPEVTILRLKRNMQSVVESELRGFRELGSINPIPAGLDIKAYENPAELVVNQILCIEKKLDEEMARIPQQRRLDWTYEEFLDSPKETVKKLSSHIGIAPDWSKLDVELRPSSRNNVDKDSKREIAKLIAEAGA